MAFASSQRHLTNGLPSHSFGNQEKHHRHSAPWTKPVSLAIPGRLGRRRGPLLICFIALSIFGVYFIVSRRYEGREWMEQWPSQSGDPSTLVFQRQDLQRIWKWEIASGHYPSRASIPKHIGLKEPPHNPAIPPKLRVVPPSRYRPPTTAVAADTDIDTLGTGPKRVYLDIQSKPPDVAYPPRPVAGSIADMDVVMKHCDFSTGKYVRDCLEVLRLGGGLDNGRRVRRGKMDDWKYIFLEQEGPAAQLAEDFDQQPIPIARPASPNVQRERDPNAGLNKKPNTEWESSIALQPVVPSAPAGAKNDACDPNNPRVFHMFWTGAFTDKPYLALMSYLFSQNTGIHLQANETGPNVCRPQFWLWINPGPAASVPNPSAVHDMYEQLKTSPWAAPFLHPRFKDIIQFKLWNTTEQLDGVPELKDEWRALSGSLFNSGGQVISVPEEKIKAVESGAGGNSTSTKEDDMLNRTGSKSLSSYDRLSVILSDMARFVLCHRFGGIYLDADTIFLRDWEELWGWKGAFAYRWSRLENYNTAVLRMNKNSALGTFLFRTALKNGLDFHPMTVTKYMADAHLEGLLLRLPDALFDSAWLNTEYFQRERPPQPYFTEFADLFDTPPQNSAAPQALGFEGFFRGAYSYHFHNFWWKPFDPSRNWPDLGPRFIAGERAARHALTTASAPSPTDAAGAEADKEDEDSVTDDKRDLDWSTVLKRTFESYIRGERPNMYGEWIHW